MMNTVASQPGSHAALSAPDGADTSPSRLFRHSAAALIGMGLLVVALTLWLGPDAHLFALGRRGATFGPWMSQLLLTGNLALGLLWIWLDVLAWRRGIHHSESRGDLLVVMCFVVAGVVSFGLLLAGATSGDDFFVMILLGALPTLAVMLPLLWMTARRIESLWLETLIPAGFGAASAFAQGCVDDSPARGGEGMLVANSYLIGAAIAVWLIAWAASPSPRRNS
jgi:hypothetical protein